MPSISSTLSGNGHSRPQRHSKRLRVLLAVLLLVTVAGWACGRYTTWFGPWLADGIGRVLGADRWR